MMCPRRLVAFALVSACLAPLASPAAARGGQVIYKGRGTYEAPVSLSLGGVTATETNGRTLNVNFSYGLGVVGGIGGFQDLVIDGSESVDFRFDAGPATGVSFRIGSYVEKAGEPGSEDLEGFDAFGRSLGVVSFALDRSLLLSAFNVSAQFGGTPLSSFRIGAKGTAAGISLGQIDFSNDAQPVTATPEPSTIAMAGVGLAALGAVNLCRHARR